MAKTANRDEGVDFGRLPGYIGYQMRQAQAAIFRDFGRIMQDVGITPGEFSLLAMVNANPGINQITLARVYRLDKSTLSYSVNGLKRRRLLRVTRSQQDRRYYGLHLTDAGREVLERATARVEAQERKMDTALAPGEREVLLDLLRRIAAAFD